MHHRQLFEIIDIILRFRSINFIKAINPMENWQISLSKESVDSHQHNTKIKTVYWSPKLAPKLIVNLMRCKMICSILILGLGPFFGDAHHIQ